MSARPAGEGLPAPEDMRYAPDPARPLGYLAECPAYRVTPLVAVADGRGGTVRVKDETDRMGLGAFKALGGPYAIARLIAEAWAEETGEEPTPAELTTPALKDFAAGMTFVCASAGNHGMGVAAGARLFGARARIHLAETVPESFAERLADKDAAVVRSGATYEESLAAAFAEAEAPGVILLPDMPAPGVLHAPSLVMEGYTVIAEELREAFEASGAWPSHVFLQAGVGGLAAAMAERIRANWTVQPEIVVVEPEAARCLAASAEAGHPVAAGGPVSNMGRLDCKEPSVIAFAVLEKAAVTYDAVSDAEAQAAADHLTAQGIATTPSGAAGLAGLWRAREAGTLSADATPLIIASEGDV